MIPFSDPAAERQRYRQIEAETQTRNRARAASSYELITRLGSLSAHYPHVEAGVLRNLAMRGVEAGSPEAESTAKAAAKMETDDGGGFFKDLGDIVSFVPKKIAGAAREVGEAVTDLARPVLRGGFTALETPLQEISGLAGDIASGAAGAAQVGLSVAGGVAGGALGSLGGPLGTAAGIGLGTSLGSVVGDFIEGDDPVAHSTGALALGDLLEGKKVDLGTGFFSGGKVRKDQASIMRQLGKDSGLGDQGFTVGRYFANEIFEPGTVGYKTLSGLTDLGISLGLDPANLAGAQFSKINAARKTLLADQALPWLQSSKAKGIREYLAGETNMERLWQNTGKNLHARTAKELTEASTEDQVVSILAREFGAVDGQSPNKLLMEKPQVKGVARRGVEQHLFFGRPIHNVRLFGGAPGGVFDLRDDNQMVENISRVLLNAKVDETIRGQRMMEYLDAGDSPEGKYQVIRKIYSDDIATKLADEGVDSGSIRRVTQLFFDQGDEQRAYWVQQVADQTEESKVLIDSLGLEGTDPHLVVEALNSTVELPDFRTIRRAISPYRNILADKELAQRMPLAFASSLQNDVWKRTALLRLAYPIRVIGEEQFRIGAAGMESMFRHPVSFIATLIGKKGLGREFFEDADGVAAINQAMVREWAGYIDAPTVSKGTARYRPDDDRFVDALANEYAKYHSDPVMRRIANGGLLDGDRTPGSLPGIEGVRDWFLNGPGSQFRKWLADNPKFAAYAEPGEESSKFIDTVVERLRQFDGGDQTIRDSIATGKFNGKKIIYVDDMGKPKVAKEFKTYLQTKVDNGEFSPDFEVAGDKYLRGFDSGVKRKWDDATNWLFSGLMAKPTNWLSRSPTFEQKWWERMEKMIPNMDDGARQELLALAGKAKLDKYNLGRANPIKRMEKAIAERGAGKVTWKEADQYAKGYALDETRKLLYDLSERGQFFDVTRLLFPFGEAWKEVVTRWTSLLAENPRIARRFQQGIEGARGAGFFYTSDVTGEEVFAYPGTAFLTKNMPFGPGMEIPLEGRVAGLSMTSEVLPGIGPVAQIPAAWFLPNSPDFDSVREVLFPFGEPDNASFGGVLKEFLPSWSQKIAQGAGFELSPDDQVAFNGTVMHIASQLVSTGKVERPESQAAMQELLADASSKARRFWLIRGSAQFGAPSAPSPEFLAMDSDGTLVAAMVLKNKFREAAERDGYTKATTDFINEHGDQAFLLLQSQTNSLVYGAPVTKEGVDWIRRNPKLAKALPTTHGLFAPIGGEFDYDSYRSGMTRGDREPITPEQALQLANNRIARNVLDQWKEKLGEAATTDKGRAMLSALKSYLTVEYPGYNPGLGGVAGIGSKPAPELAIQELRSATKHKQIRETSQGQALDLFLQAWDTAEAKAQAAGLADHLKAKSARPLRQALRQYADRLNKNYEGFAPIFDQVFDRLLSDDFEEELGSQAA